LETCQSYVEGTRTTCRSIIKLLQPANVRKIFEALSYLCIGICSPITRKTTVPSSLHRKQDAGVSAVEVVIVQVLHHQQGAPIVLVHRIHNVVHLESAIIQGGCKQVGAQIIRNLSRVQTLTSIDACKETSWVVEELFESSFATSLLLGAVLVNDSGGLVNRPNIVTNLGFVLSLVLMAELFKGLLAHKNELVVHAS